MNTATALKIIRDSQKSNLKPHTALTYRYFLNNFEESFGKRALTSMSSEEIFKSKSLRATFASRNGVPLEIILKVLLRHQSFKTTKSFNYIPAKF